MLGYVAEAFTRLLNKHPHNPQDQPYPCIKPTYGAKSQYAEASDEYPPLSKENKNNFQEVTGTLLYYSRVVDPTMLISLGSIAAHQANPVEQTMKKLKQLLDYAATHPDTVITYQASDMVLAGHSNDSYLSETKARSRAGGHLFMSNNTAFPLNNGAVLNISKIIKAGMS